MLDASFLVMVNIPRNDCVVVTESIEGQDQPGLTLL